MYFSNIHNTFLLARVGVLFVPVKIRGFFGRGFSLRGLAGAVCWWAGFVGGRGLLVGWVLLAGAVCGRVQFVGEFSLLARAGEGWRKKSALFFSLIGGPVGCGYAGWGLAAGGGWRD
jgi:hypothetical protein